MRLHSGFSTVDRAPQRGVPLERREANRPTDAPIGWWRRGGILIEIRRMGLLNVLQRAGLKVQSEIRRRIDK
jgi:hypothetical protein